MTQQFEFRRIQCFRSKTYAGVACSALLLALVALSPACGDDGGPASSAAGSSAGGSAGAPSTAGGGGAGAAEPGKLGGFSVNVKVDENVTSVAGVVYDGATAESVIWKTRATSGGCKLLIPEAPFCDPACGTKVCIPGNQCVANPKAIAVGNVRVQGIGSSEFTMSPSDTLSYGLPDGVTIPYPPSADGAPIRFIAEGGALGAFTLEAPGIAPFEITSATPVTIEDGKALALTWKKGANDDARIDLKLDLSHHGGTKGKIECDVADTGSLELPATLLDQLIDLGVSGFPVIDIGRTVTRSASVTGGVVELTILSRTRVDVTVPGLVSCYVDSECPTGQKCQEDLKCQ